MRRSNKDYLTPPSARHLVTRARSRFTKHTLVTCFAHTINIKNAFLHTRFRAPPTHSPSQLLLGRSLNLLHHNRHQLPTLRDTFTLHRAPLRSFLNHHAILRLCKHLHHQHMPNSLSHRPLRRNILQRHSTPLRYFHVLA